MNDGYTRDPKRVEKLLREKGVVVVMGRDHAKTPQDVINTVQGIYEAGLIAEVTFRIPEGILKEAMTELRIVPEARHAASYNRDPAGYEEAVMDFVNRALARKPRPPEGGGASALRDADPPAPGRAGPP